MQGYWQHHADLQLKAMISKDLSIFVFLGNLASLLKQVYIVYEKSVLFWTDIQTICHWVRWISTCSWFLLFDHKLLVNLGTSRSNITMLNFKPDLPGMETQKIVVFLCSFFMSLCYIFSGFGFSSILISLKVIEENFLFILLPVPYPQEDFGFFDKRFTCVFQDDGHKLHWCILSDQTFTTTSEKQSCSFPDRECYILYTSKW